MAEPTCKQERMALGLPYTKSWCEQCGSSIYPNWRCPREVTLQVGDVQFTTTGTDTDMEIESHTPLHNTETLAETSGTGWNQSIVRMRVDGGWLYVIQLNSIRGNAMTATFVPDTPRPIERKL